MVWGVSARRLDHHLGWRRSVFRGRLASGDVDFILAERSPAAGNYIPHYALLVDRGCAYRQTFKAVENSDESDEDDILR